MKPARYSEDELVKEFNKGNPRAFSQLYDLYYAHLCYFAYRLIDNEVEAQDIAATSLESLILKYTEFATMTNIKAYLYIGVRNKSLNYLRHVTRTKIESLEGGEVIKDQTEEGNRLEIEMINSKLLHSIYVEIENLSETRKKVFKMFYLDGLKVNEIADQLGMTPGTVSTYKYKALMQLRNTLINKKLLSIITAIFCFKKTTQNIYFS